MEVGERISLEQIQAFLKGSEGIQFEGKSRVEMYEWVSRLLRQHGYAALRRPAKGLIRGYIAKVTGLSRAQVTRLLRRYGETQEVKEKAYQRNRFVNRYTRADIELLAEVDEAHETLSGPATQKILHRARHEFGDERYDRLASLSAAHIYNLRKSRTYRQKRVRYEKTRPVQVAIGERRRPKPDGKPGYLRVDTVHQGDQDGMKGVYHINAVDEVTQWQVVGATAQISEAFLLPVLVSMMEQFPFVLRGFHSDNGSEFINHTVAGLLEKLRIEQTKSRPRRSNDNALAEAKNGAVIRKHMGYGHIGSAHAEAIHTYYEKHLNPYLNFHRPCGQAELVETEKGKQRRIYRWYATPWEVLRQLPGVAGYLKPELTIHALNAVAQGESDTQAARTLQDVRRRLFATFQPRRSA